MDQRTAHSEHTHAASPSAAHGLASELGAAPAAQRMSLRVNMTLWTLGTFLVIQAVLVLVLVYFQDRSIETFFNERLAYRLQIAAERVRPQLPMVSDEALVGIVREQHKSGPPLEADLYLLDEHGALLATDRHPGHALSTEWARRVLDSSPNALILPRSALTGRIVENSAPHIAAMRLDSPDGRTFILMEVTDGLVVKQMMALLHSIALITIPIGVLAMGIAAYIVSGKMTRPLLHIAAAAKRLAPEAASPQVDVPPLAVEVAAVREELEKARKRIEAGFATQERFMSNVSHELKTPIATIVTQIQTLKLDGVPAPVREFLRSVTEELEKLAQMVDSFLLLTRVRHGKGQVPAAAHCVIRDVLMESYAVQTAYAKQHNVRIELQLPEGPDAEAAVIGNCDLLRMIFDNILRNAVRFSPSNSVISVRAWVEDSKVHVSVRDRGTGIPPELLPRIFDRFSRASDDQRRGRGHGLGLEITLGITELHSGDISVVNCDDGGCEFTVRIPLAAATR